ncbi:MAG TPA: hypothetical protein VJ828_05975 [Lacipirellulaceae bacterium]|nr:hypothetical protein [Lacipirellulaceae bacterium]
MSKREKILAAIVLGIGAILAMQFLWGRYQKSLRARESELATAKENLADINLAIEKGQHSLRKLEAWQKRSLPANREKALSLYKAWLLAKAKDAGLKVEGITPASRQSTNAAYKSVGYSMTATGSLSSVATLLHEFYRSPQLQKVTLLRLMRPVGASQIQVTFDAEALILPGAEATDSLPEGESKRLALASLADYQKSLGDRDLMSVYTPPRPPVVKTDPPAPPKFDDSEHARFSASIGIGDKFQAWIHVRTTGETLHLRPGDTFKVGQLEGQIVSVEPRSMVYQAGDKKYRVTLDQPLRKGTELGPDGKPLASARSERPES